MTGQLPGDRAHPAGRAVQQHRLLRQHPGHPPQQHQRQRDGHQHATRLRAPGQVLRQRDGQVRGRAHHLGIPVAAGQGGHRLTGAKASHPAPDPANRARNLHAGHERHHAQAVADPVPDVGEVDPGKPHGDRDLTRARFRFRQVRQGEHLRAAVFGYHHRPHGTPFTPHRHRPMIMQGNCTRNGVHYAGPGAEGALGSGGREAFGVSRIVMVTEPSTGSQVRPVSAQWPDGGRLAALRS